MIVPLESKKEKQTFFFNTHSHFLSAYCMMLVRTSEHLNFPVIVSFHLLTSEKKEKNCKKMLDVTLTRDRNAYFVFTLELMLSLTPAIYQRDVRDVSNEKNGNNRKRNREKRNR